MAYLITTTDGTVVGQVLPQTTNTSISSLTLIGQGLKDYGQYLNDDLIALTENFAAATSPVYPLAGQLWYNKPSQVLNYYNGLGWNVIASELWVEENFAASASLSPIANIIASDGLNSDGTKPNYSSNNYILNSDSLLSAIGKLDLAIAGSGSQSAYLTIAAAQAEYAPLNSPNLIGTPLAPTAVTGTNNTQIATTAFVNSLVNYNNNTVYASIANNYLTIATAQSEYAPLVSPNLVGTPTAPTAGLNNRTSQIATTAFVINQIQGGFNFDANGNGYQTFPNGFILQWGNFGSTGQQSVVFPMAFPHACLCVVASIAGNPGDFQDVVHVGAYSTEAVIIYTGQTLTTNNSTLATGISVTYFAVGH